MDSHRNGRIIMHPDTIEFIRKMFASELTIHLKDVEAIARIKEDFKQWAATCTQSSQEPTHSSNPNPTE